MNIQSWNWGSVPEWLAAVGTISAVYVAIWVATLESRATRARELVNQAKRIAVWKTEFSVNSKIVIYNNSTLPIYDVLLSNGIAYGAGQPYLEGKANQTFLLKVPPGKYYATPPKDYGGGMHTKMGVSVSFRDSNGKYWRRDATGILVQTKLCPFDEMKVGGPITDWGYLTKIED